MLYEIPRESTRINDIQRDSTILHDGLSVARRDTRIYSDRSVRYKTIYGCLCLVVQVRFVYQLPGSPMFAFRLVPRVIIIIIRVQVISGSREGSRGIDFQLECARVACACVDD